MKICTEEKNKNKNKALLCTCHCAKSLAIFQNSPFKVGINTANLEMKKLKFSVFKKKIICIITNYEGLSVCCFPRDIYCDIVTNL